MGYDATNLAAETYDWRLSVPALEERDGFFTRLKARCEALVATNRPKGGGETRTIAILAHPWGDSVVRAFFLWADHRVRELLLPILFSMEGEKRSERKEKLKMIK